MAEWHWHYTDEELPAITSGDGTSDYVLAFPGSGCLPKVVKYSDGSSTTRGWPGPPVSFTPVRPPLNAGVWSLSFAAEIPLLGEHRAADIRETIGTRKKVNNDYARD